MSKSTLKSPMRKTVFIGRHAIYPLILGKMYSVFSDEEINRYKKVIESTAHLIMEFSQKGGFNNFAQKAENDMDALWDSSKWSDKKNEEMLKDHLRTPYKINIP